MQYGLDFARESIQGTAKLAPAPFMLSKQCESEIIAVKKRSQKNTVVNTESDELIQSNDIPFLNQAIKPQFESEVMILRPSRVQTNVLDGDDIIVE